jgi:putative colanic acid biosynthesis glycosyltransferase
MGVITSASGGQLSDFRTPFLSIITVVFNDWPGLERTLASVAPHRSAAIEHWIIDGSSDGQVRKALAGHLPARTFLVSEPDDGLYDAMNKGLTRSSGEYALFLNAGDSLHEEFSLDKVVDAANGQVILGYSIERWKGDRFLRPGLGRESDALSMPAHQATFYPKRFYAANRYTLTRPIGADGAYTAHAVKAAGATFLPVVVCEFEMGGRSTRYDTATTKARLLECRTNADRAKIHIKRVLWVVLPQDLFYRFLARGKFTRLATSRVPALQLDALVLAAEAGTTAP